ncbi:hypothetical protein FTS83_02535 [Salmonella enterica subsp. salamae]|nr:hypothetical protein [Salmonella enterica subsp. salamae serovar Sofia]ECD9449729.1 hypothetical protein [Salmonella enterica subsp. salamae serovar Sofia]ECL7265907.1 hypothetical protein [Salmonella enterica subsp. salamae]
MYWKAFCRSRQRKNRHKRKYRVALIRCRPDKRSAISQTLCRMAVKTAYPAYGFIVLCASGQNT